MTPLQRYLRVRIEHAGLNNLQVSRQAGLNDTAVRDIVEGRSKRPRHETLKRISEVLGCTVEDLYQPMKSAEVQRKNANATSERGTLSQHSVTILELDVRAEGGPGAIVDDAQTAIAAWQMPRDLLSAHTTASQTGIKIIRVYGDSMAPDFRPGDRVMVDTDDRIPSPPGVFVLWDGFGLVLKRVDMVPYSYPPLLKLKSSNTVYDVYERTLDEVTINGRVIGRWEWT